MNFCAIAFSITAALVSSASALITFTAPSTGSVWYANVPNYFQISSDNSAETSATVRFASCKQCFALSVPVNTSMPVVIPRHIRGSNFLNLYAVSNSGNTATSFVYVANNLPCNPCAPPCARRGRCGRLYAEEGSEQAEEGASCLAELSYIDINSPEAEALRAEQDQAMLDLAEDIAASQQQAQN